jgi:glycine dehydrogenase subunit 1
VEDLYERGYAAHAIGDHELQVCVTETNHGRVDGFVEAFAGAA